MKRNITIKSRIALCVLFVLVCAGICAIFVSCDNDGGSHSDIGGTNVQEMGVDEGDIAKYVGEYLYILQPDGITVSRTLSNGAIQLVSSYRQSGVTPCEMYISSDRLIAIYTYIRRDGVFCRVWSSVRIFDVRGISENFSFENNEMYALDFKGKYLDSRIVIKQKKMLLCYGLQDREEIESVNVDENGRPVFEYRATEMDYEVNGEKKTVADAEPLKNIPEGLTSHDITVYASIDLSENKFEVKMKATSGFPFQTLYVSEYGFYTAYSYVENRRMSGGCGGTDWQITHSMIAKIDGKTLELTGQKFFDGMSLVSRHAVKDTGKNVYFAMLNTDYRAVVLLATDENLNLVGYLSDICQEEEVKSVSYAEDGDRLYCFIVTYQEAINLDPLFKIDVTDPGNMKVKGLVSVDGFSSYTINFEGGYTVGVGEDGAGGIKISLFATEKDLPREINSFVKNNAYSEATDNSKAFCVDKSRKLFAVPIIEIVDAATLTERLYFYRITDEGELEELGFVENRESFAYQSESEIRVQDLYLRRAFFGENFVYAVSGANIKSLSISELAKGNMEGVCEISTKIE